MLVYLVNFTLKMATLKRTGLLLGEDRKMVLIIFLILTISNEPHKPVF